ncbi:unnamed protein product, partial [Vitis vinifera]|uniref:Uncharacterized protein n=1 Tax=Vitis vinifera TaxID=29760 RepID=D7TBP8_VITVI
MKAALERRCKIGFEDSNQRLVVWSVDW